MEILSRSLSGHLILRYSFVDLFARLMDLYRTRYSLV